VNALRRAVTCAALALSAGAAHAQTTEFTYQGRDAVVCADEGRR